MNTDDVINTLKYSLPDLTDYPFYVQEAIDDGGKVVELFVVHSDAGEIQGKISNKHQGIRICIIPQGADQIDFMNKCNE